MENYWDRKSPLPKRGKILLQTHGGEIRWRNMFVREIPTAEANELLRKHGAKGFASVFNGKDFDGWAGPVDQYEVVDGAIVCKPKKGGNIYTKAEYGDFVIRLEYRLPPGGNNGLAIRYPGKRPAVDESPCARCRSSTTRRLEVREARSAAVQRLGLRHGPGSPRLPAAGRRMELHGGDGEGLDAPGGTERHAHPRRRPEQGDGVQGQRSASRQGPDPTGTSVSPGTTIRCSSARSRSRLWKRASRGG